MGKVTTVSAFKGGVGKTTTATNLAAASKLLAPKKNFCLADLDFQTNVAMAFNYDLKNIKSSIYEVLHGDVDIHQAILHHTSGIDILPSSFDLCAFDLDLFENEDNKFPLADRPFILQKLFEPLKKEYDHIICDAGPSLSMLAVNYITLSDQFIVVLQTGRFALNGAMRFIDYIHKVRKSYCPNKEYEICMIVTFFDASTNVSTDVLQEARKYCLKKNIYIPDTVVSKTVRFENSQSYNGAPLVLNENSKYSQQYLDLAKELILDE